jgi:hypothetical protein
MKKSDFDLIRVDAITRLPSYNGLYEVITNSYWAITYDEHGNKCVLRTKGTKTYQRNDKREIVQKIVNECNYPAESVEQITVVFLKPRR